MKRNRTTGHRDARPRRAGGLLLALALLLAAAPGQARNLALLVGVGSYQAIRGLEGPPNDVAALRDVLVRRWGFAPADVRTLVDGEATRAAILGGLDALAADSAPGDEVLFYFSGHGTSRYNPGSSLPLPHGSGALVPWDARRDGPEAAVAGSLIVGLTDLRPRLARLDQGGRHLTVIFDSCFSGSAAKGRPGFPTRYHDFGPASVGEDPMSRRRYGSAERPAADPWPYDGVFFLAAASDSEVADDIPSWLLGRWPTIDNSPHGAFTDALLRVLTGQLPADGDGDGRLSHEELKAALARALESGGHNHRPQSLPQAREDRQALAQRGLFGRGGGGGGVSRPGAAPVYRVRLEDEAPEVRQRLARTPGLALVEGTADLVVRREGPDLTLGTEGGETAGRLPAADAGAVCDRIMQLHWFQQLSWRGDTANPFRFRLGLQDETRGGRLFKGERFSLRLELGRRAWLVILYVDAAGEVAALYPYLAAETAPRDPGQSLTIPAAGAPLFVAKDPLGTDLVVAYAFTERPAFLDQLPGRTVLAANESLYRLLLEAVARAPQEVAVATLALVTEEPQR